MIFFGDQVTFLCFTFLFYLAMIAKGFCCLIISQLAQTPLGTRPGLGTQPHYEAPSDFRVDIDKT